jgi:hypothetical protein
MCESCFNVHVAEQIESGVTAQEIRFKPFNGNREDAANTVFGYIPEMTLWKHLLTLDPSLKESEEEMEYQILLKNKKKGLRGDPCSRCNEKEAVRMCDICQALYCGECYDFKHLTPPWDNHTWTQFEHKVKLRSSSPAKGKVAKAAKLLEEREERGRSLERARGKRGIAGGRVLDDDEGLEEDRHRIVTTAGASSASLSPASNQTASKPKIEGRGLGSGRGDGRGHDTGRGRGRGRGGRGRGRSPSPGRGGRGRGGRGRAEPPRSRSPSPPRGHLPARGNSGRAS